MTSLADFGITIGTLPSGPTNSVIDVPGVGVGHTTIVRDEPPPPVGRGTARTGVTVLDLGGDAWARPVAAGGAVLNGAGECTGWQSAQEWGLVESPIYLTSTMQLGRVYDAACRIALAEAPGVADDVVIPVVGECDDSWLSFAGAMQVEFEDVVSARDAARESVGSGLRPPTGAVGAGTGMLCLGWKGGIGTASRVAALGAHRRGPAADELRAVGPPHGRWRAGGAAAGPVRARGRPVAAAAGAVPGAAPESPAEVRRRRARAWASW